MKKEKIYLYLTTLFTIITLTSVGYVLAKKGQVNAGLSLIPCLFSIIFSNLYIKEKTKHNKINEIKIRKHNKVNKIIVVITIIFLILNIITTIIIK